MNIEGKIEIIVNSPKTGEKKTIRYKEQSLLLDVQEIPLDTLSYNPYNGRIRSMVKSFETSQGRNIDSKQDLMILEQYLWESAKGKNEKTLESLREIGQQEIGIVTKDGVIIDGNRRACLLNIIKREDSSRNVFKAIVLPDTLQENAKEITLLETRYQMGVDSKVDYNPIEKYIRCHELVSIHDFTISEISDLMAENELKIQEWLFIFDLMEDYLKYLSTPHLYTRLEKREGHFVDLFNYLNQYKKNKNFTNWATSDEDLINLKEVYFDYIRLGIPVQRARVIAKPTGGNSFFCKREIWNEFIIDHKEKKVSINEIGFGELKNRHPDRSNEDIIHVIDEGWKKELEEFLIENLSYNEITLKEINETFVPLKLLRRIKTNVEKINSDSVESNTKEEVLRIIDSVVTTLSQIKNNLINN